MPQSGFDAARLARIRTHFAPYVDDGRLPGWQVQVCRHGDVVYHASYGQRDLEAGLPVEDDTVFRIYSMTKPITTVAALMLYEEGRFELTDPIAEYLPEFADMRVITGGPALKPATRPAQTPIRILNLMNHTSGLTYGFHRIHVQDEIYRNAGYDWGAPAGKTLADCVHDWARMPLRFDPGTRWNYSVSTDVLGRLVEVLSGQTLDRFFRERILDPLGMKDTAFRLRGDLGERLAALYVPGVKGRATRNDMFGDAIRGDVPFLSGGGGLISTTADYQRFLQMLLNGGQLAGARILGSRTVRRMMRNTLPGGQDLVQCGIPLFAEVNFSGQGFGLGGAVVVDPVATGTLCSPGEFSWGGAASTGFWVDPLEQISVVLMTQLLPSSTYPLRTQLRQLVYSALVD